MVVTNELIEAGQKILSEAFDNYNVHYSETVCDMYNCTDGNHMILPNGKTVNFRRYINTRRNRVYWCYSE